jgi:hypothetical protein
MRFRTLWQVIAEGLVLVAEKGLVRSGCIALKLKNGLALADFRNSQARSAHAGRPPGEIYFETSECSPGGRQLWSQRTAAVQRYGQRDTAIEADNLGARSDEGLVQQSLRGILCG